MTPMLEQAFLAAKELPETDQDALAANTLEWIEDERRWAESFARTHEALAELAREALAEYDGSHDPYASHAERAADECGAKYTMSRLDTNLLCYGEW